MTHVKFTRRPFEKGFNNLVDDFFSELPVLYKSNPEWKGFVPVNIRENETAFQVEVIAPGFDKQDFRINVEENILTVSAEKKNETKENQPKEIRREYNYRSFKRSFTIEDKIDVTNIEAKYVNGVLTLNLPKKEEVKTSAKEITIQ